MAASDEVVAGVRGVINATWSITNGQVVPKTEGVTLYNGAVKLDVTYLYADLANSTGAAQNLTQEATGKIIRSFLNAAVRVVRHYGGEIRSFDGDRVMAIYVGDYKNTNAVKTAMGINWAVSEVVWPELCAYWPTLPDFWTMNHGVGVATGEAMIVRGGVRNNNDLVSIGNAPNIAAKLSELRGMPKTFVTDDVYQSMNQVCYTGGERNEHMWARGPVQNIGGTSVPIWASTWWWRP